MILYSKYVCVVKYKSQNYNTTCLLFQDLMSAGNYPEGALIWPKALLSFHSKHKRESNPQTGDWNDSGAVDDEYENQEKEQLSRCS
jgi:hypothetical protein